jgi:hypothetical protein
MESFTIRDLRERTGDLVRQGSFNHAIVPKLEIHCRSPILMKARGLRSVSP